MKHFIKKQIMKHFIKKQIILSISFILLYFNSQAQTVIFSDNFESGTSSWVLTNSWGLDSTYKYGGSFSITESPYSDYSTYENSSITMASGVDLSLATDANVSFWGTYDIEPGYDYMYLEASDNDSVWVVLDVFSDEVLIFSWIKYTYSLGSFIGSDDVKVRFRFTSDFVVNYDGMYIDDFEINATIPPVANFILSHNNICVGESITFTDISNNLPTTWNWSFPGGNYLNNTNNTAVVQYDTAGIYDVTLQVGNSAGYDTITMLNVVVVENCIGLEEEYSNNITYSIYPNPTTNYIVIEQEEDFISTINIYSTIGQLISTKKITNKSTTINTSHLTNGTYFLIISNEKEMYTHKIIKK